MIRAEVICDSLSTDGYRLTTLQLRYPKFIHGEFMTHRVFSRNASSSRAVPTSKLIEEVRSDELRAAPVAWGKNQPGMQAYEELSGNSLESVKGLWKYAACVSADAAEYMATVGAHKQIVNRILEPFTHINVVCSATEFDNFFGLRLDGGADPTMRALAEAMWTARAASVPNLKGVGEWHLPYVSDDDDELNADINNFVHHGPGTLSETAYAKRVSVARCARVSYTSFESGRRSTFSEDLALYDKLITARPAHMSPAEHQATPDRVGDDGLYDYGGWGNFTGWRQYRKMLSGERVAPMPEGY